MASVSNHDGCRTAYNVAQPSCLRLHPDSHRGRFRRVSGHLKSPSRIFPQVLSRCFRIAGTFCRQRWFARYARSESLLCLQRLISNLRATGNLSFRMLSFLPC